MVPAASPPDNLQQVLDDVFDVQQLRGTEGAGPHQAEFKSEHPLLHCPKTAPADSLLVRQACAVLCCAVLCCAVLCCVLILSLDALQFES